MRKAGRKEVGAGGRFDIFLDSGCSQGKAGTKGVARMRGARKNVELRG